MRKYFIQKSESVVCQEIKDGFNETPLVTRSCVKAINSLIHHLSIHKVNKDTINNILLCLLRAFQSNESYLKRIIYSSIIELSKHTDQGFVSINILVKDLCSKKDDNKIEVLKALFTVVPKEMVYDFEAYVTQALLSNNKQRVDAGVVICNLLLERNFNKVKSWVSNLDISNDIYGYHKLSLLDKANLLSKFDKVWACKEESAILAVRILSQKLSDDPSFINYFKNFLNVNLNSEMVFFEACKSIMKMKEEIAIQFIGQAVQGLKFFIKSTNFSHKFATMRIVSLLCLRYPKNIASLNGEIEELLAGDSKTISMLAISCLLKTGNEDTVDRLVKRLPEFMNEMDDNYKKMSIDTLEALATTYESKSNVFIDFLAVSMQQRGPLGFKMYLLEVFSRNIKKDFLRERILEVLCMYIEDSEHYQLSMEILDILSREIPNALNPRKYLLHVYNRLILEDNRVRGAALQCLYNLSMNYDVSIGLSTIKRCINDSDKMVSSMSKFLLINLENRETINEGGDFRLEELGDLKEEVLNQMGVNQEVFIDQQEEETQTNVALTKVCREISISPEASEIKVLLTKKLIEGKKLLSFVIENGFDDVQILLGKLSLKYGDTLLGLDVPTIPPKKSYSCELEVEVDVNDVVNGVFDYELCVEEDLSETENESLPLTPFVFTYFDLSTPSEVFKRPSQERSTKFALKKDLTASSKKILDLLNLKILSQESLRNRLTMTLSGVYEGESIFVEVDISFTKVSECNVNMYCDDSDLLQALVEYFN